MSHTARKLDELLLDYHLGRLGPDEAARVEQAIGESAELAAKSEVLARTLSRLDAWDVPTPPTDMTEAVLDRVRIASETISLSRGASALPAGAEAAMSGSPILSIRELVAIAACITLFVGVFVPGYRKAQNIARRQLCARNMQAMMTGIGAYAQTYDGQLPFAGTTRGASWLRHRTPGVARAPNSRHPYLLVRFRFVKSDKFICPAREDAIILKTDEPEEFDDFPEPANINYDTQNMGGPRPRLGVHPQMAIVADHNPLLEGGHVHRITPYDDPNSLSHGAGAGQNVGYCSGHVTFTNRPTCGVNGDDIWRPGQVKRLTGLDVPLYLTDSFLIP